MSCCDGPNLLYNLLNEHQARHRIPRQGRRPAAFLHRGPQHCQPFLLCSELTGQNGRHCAAAIEGLDPDAAPPDLPILLCGNYVQWLGGRFLGVEKKRKKEKVSSKALLG